MQCCEPFLREQFPRRAPFYKLARVNKDWVVSTGVQVFVVFVPFSFLFFFFFFFFFFSFSRFFLETRAAEG
jgi:hypothetical protein